jgi:hypothetical protein
VYKKLKANLPTKFNQLSPSEKQRIYDACDAQLAENANVILDLYLKMSCAILHDAFGFGEKRLNCYLGNYRRMFRAQAKLVKSGKQSEEMNRRMRKIFRKDGYPDCFFSTMISGWDIDTNGGTDEQSS